MGLAVALNEKYRERVGRYSAGFQPSEIWWARSWGGAPGWYIPAPSALAGSAVPKSKVHLDPVISFLLDHPT